jgi:hypothetical protein
MENSSPKPRYSWCDALQVAMSLSMRALEEVRALARIPGPRGADGPPGKDGLGFDDLTIDKDDDGRTVIFRWARGERSREYKLTFPVVIYRGIWREGGYKADDMVTWDGSVWVAAQDTTDKPDKSDHWKLAVRKGREGKDGIVRAEEPRKPVALR